MPKTDMFQPLILLTGATGLLGSWVLERLLLESNSVAVLARDDHRGDARQRVESALAPFEQHRQLPRPRVIAGDLARPACGIHPTDQAWLAGQKVHVVHCAASIRFIEDGEGEPYRTNVKGTQNLLELCSQFSVCDFHHVSTAYVGARTGNPVFEVAIEGPASGGNDYERSKIQAERLVDEFNELTGRKVFHRPSIVVGDSQSYRTTTFHGFYAPLQIGTTLARANGFSKGLGEWFRSQLGLADSDQKNLVPVDWVADQIARVVLDSEVGSGVYHWTHPNPTPAVVMQNAITDAIEMHLTEKGGETSEEGTGGSRFSNLHSESASSIRTPEISSAFREQMSVYESYFSGDPVFDRSAAGKIATRCPTLDYEALRAMCSYALAANFGWPKPPLVPLPSDLGALPAFECATRDSGQFVGQCFGVVTLGNYAPPPIFLENDGSRWVSTSIGSTDCGWCVKLPLKALTGRIIGTSGTRQLFEQGNAIALGELPSNWLAIFDAWIQDVIAQSSS